MVFEGRFRWENKGLRDLFRFLRGTIKSLARLLEGPFKEVSSSGELS